MLTELAGRWEGEGKTHEGTLLKGTLDLEPLAGGRGFALAFKAVGADGTVLCRHRGILAGDRLAFLDDGVGELKILDRRGPDVFGSGEPAAIDSYRVEVTFHLAAANEMHLTIATGLPGEPFVPRVRGTFHRA